MPKKIDPQVRERAVRLVLEHRAEYPSNAQAVAAIARQGRVGAEHEAAYEEALTREFSPHRSGRESRTVHIPSSVRR